jgi:hypothetical protein
MKQLVVPDCHGTQLIFDASAPMVAGGDWMAGDMEGAIGVYKTGVPVFENRPRLTSACIVAPTIKQSTLLALEERSTQATAFGCANVIKGGVSVMAPVAGLTKIPATQPPLPWLPGGTVGSTARSLRITAQK